MGDIVLTRQPGFGSWFLRIFSGPFPYSHASLIGESIAGRPTIYAAGHTDGKRKPFAFLNYGYFRQLDAAAYLKGKNYVVCRYRAPDGREGLTPRQRKRLLGWCHHNLGEKYPGLKVFRFFTEGLKGLGVTQIIYPRYAHHEHCFESVAEAYQQAGIILNRRAGNLDPSGYDGKEIYFSPHLVDVYQA